MNLLPLRHRDPFNRLLSVPCVVEGMAMMSTDAISDR